MCWHKAKTGRMSSSLKEAIAAAANQPEMFYQTVSKQFRVNHLIYSETIYSGVENVQNSCKSLLEKTQVHTEVMSRNDERMWKNTKNEWTYMFA